MKSNHFFLVVFLLVFTFSAFSQSEQNNMNFYYAKAQAAMQNNDYQEANEHFRAILQLGTKLPSEMPYLFAKTLFEIEQFQNSQSFLNKYFEVLGKAGTYYDNAVDLQDLLKKKLDKSLSCQYCDFSGYRLEICETCHGEKQTLKTCDYCQGKGKVSCTLCSGDGVLIELGALGSRSYRTCHQCKGEGVHLCPVCEGEKELYTYCSNCLGSGSTATDVICKHTEFN